MKKHTKYNPRPYGVTSEGVSMTEPDKSFTIMEILAKSKGNIPFPARKVHYTGDVMLRDDLDLVEKKEIQDHLDDLEKAEKAEKNKKAREAAKQLLRAEIESERTKEGEKEGGGTTTPQKPDNQ